ncbi:MAG: hypothetical protein LBJ86_07045 [Spirochaetaceae bacterium]|jgi:hypothetical protein|nr:hypothetical protein [Spirochaetaceae bacterium]
MNQQFNYEDNIFILNVRIRMLADMMKLDADPDIFLAKTVEDLDFIAAKLNLLQESLSYNKCLIYRDAQLHNLDETYESFMDLLNDMARGTGRFNVINYPYTRETVCELIKRGLDAQKQITELMRDTESDIPDHRLVGTDELAALLDGI